MNAKRVVKDFPVVCVGGSAGGLDVYIRLLQHLPADIKAQGMARRDYGFSAFSN
jgi:two-component system, chemotaxis family, protein-glutamate methylesterase/glutaminase